MFKKSLGILINNLLLIQPLLLFVIFVFITLYIMQGKVISVPIQYVYLTLLFILTVALFSGWFYINKLCIEHYDVNLDSETIVRNSIADFKQFFVGVGKNFGKFLFGSVIFILINFLFSYLTSFIAMKYYIIISQIAHSNPQDVFNIVISLTDREKINLLIFIIYQFVVAFVFLYWWILMLGILQTEKENWFVSVWHSIKFIFVNLGISICILFAMLSLFFVINVLYNLFGSNVIIASVFSILLLLYLNYFVILVLSFYNEKKRDNSNSGSELVG